MPDIKKIVTKIGKSEGKVKDFIIISLFQDDICDFFYVIQGEKLNA